MGVIPRCAWCRGPAATRSIVTGIYACAGHAPASRSADESLIELRLWLEDRLAGRTPRACDSCSSARLDITLTDLGALCVPCRREAHEEAAKALGAAVLREMQGRPRLGYRGVRGADGVWR